MLERQPPHVGSERCHGDFIVKKKRLVVPKNSLIEKREERRSMGVMESPVFIAIAYELNNCPRAILVYRPHRCIQRTRCCHPLTLPWGLAPNVGTWSSSQPISMQDLSGLKEVECRNLQDLDVAVPGDVFLYAGVHIWADRADLDKDSCPVVRVVFWAEDDETPRGIGGA